MYPERVTRDIYVAEGVVDSMGAGIRAEIRVDADGTCPVVEASADLESPSHTIARSTTASTDRGVTEEFMLEADRAPAASVELTEVFDYGSKTMYRFSRERGRGCPCEAIEASDCPVVDLRADDGRLHLVFHAVDMDALRDALLALQEQYSEVDVRRLLRSEHEPQEDDLVLFDRSRLTDRQREVLRTAHGMGYFEHPKGANAGEVAAELGITTATFSEHLAAAQTKLLEAVLEG